MNKKVVVSMILCCIIFSSCTAPSKPYITEARSKTVDARAGQDYARYAIYNPAMTADAGIKAEDVDFATGTFVLLSPTEEKLKSLSELDYITLYYNQRGHVLVEIKGR